MTRPAALLRRRAPLVRALFLAITASLASPLLASAPVEAQTAVQRGAGTMERSAGVVSRGSGTRRGSDLGSRKAGPASGSRSSVTTSRPTFRKPGSDPNVAEGATGTDEPADSMAAATAYDDTSAGEGDAEASQEPVDYGTRTLGRACMYGTRGEVIFRPQGAVCRGDVRPDPGRAKGRSARTTATRPSPAAAGPTAARPSPAAASPTARRGAPRAAASRGPSRSTGSVPTRARGTCLFDGEGRVLHAPPGADCRRPADAGRTRRR